MVDFNIRPPTKQRGGISSQQMMLPMPKFCHAAFAKESPTRRVARLLRLYFAWVFTTKATTLFFTFIPGRRIADPGRQRKRIMISQIDAEPRSTTKRCWNYHFLAVCNDISKTTSKADFCLRFTNPTSTKRLGSHQKGRRKGRKRRCSLSACLWRCPTSVFRLSTLSRPGAVCLVRGNEMLCLSRVDNKWFWML